MSDNNPSQERAKLMALLALLDALRGDAQMSAVAIDRVGMQSGGPYAGKVRLKFSVFGTEHRMMELADRLSAMSPAEQLRFLDSNIDRDSKLRFAIAMVRAWTELMERLVEPGGGPRLTAGSKELPP